MPISKEARNLGMIFAFACMSWRTHATRHRREQMARLLDEEDVKSKVYSAKEAELDLKLARLQLESLRKRIGSC